MFYLRKNLFPFLGSLRYTCSRNSRRCSYNSHYGKHRKTLSTRWRLQHPCEMKKVSRIYIIIIWFSLPFVSTFLSTGSIGNYSVQMYKQDKNYFKKINLPYYNKCNFKSLFVNYLNMIMLYYKSEHDFWGTYNWVLKSLSLGKDVMVLHLRVAGDNIDQSKRVSYGWKDKIP